MPRRLLELRQCGVVWMLVFVGEGKKITKSAIILLLLMTCRFPEKLYAVQFAKTVKLAGRR